KTGLLALAAVAVLGLGAAGWWFSTRANSSATQPEPLTAVVPTPTPSAEPTPTPTPTPAAAVSPTPTVIPTPTPSPIKKDGAKGLPAATAKPTPGPSVTAVPNARATPTAAAAPVETVVLLVTIPDALPMSLELQSEVPVGATPGTPLQFTVVNDVLVGGERVVAKGATATGEILTVDKKKVSIRMRTVDALDGTKLTIRATAGSGADSKRTIETPGQKSTTVILSPGTSTIGYMSGQQSVRLRK
ncbi:MAG: hypothetical protein ABIP90_02935, partial [Vicinamibacterales bacterium]